MDVSSFLSHLQTNRRMAPPASAPAPAPAPASKPVGTTSTALPNARPQGLAGKPPYGKDRYPASFVGRPKGAKNKAPNRRQMESALASAVAMKSGNAKMEAEATAPDFLERFGVKRAVITRLSNSLSRGETTITQAMGDFLGSAQKAGYDTSGFSTTVKPMAQAVSATITAEPAVAQAQAIATHVQQPVGETPSSGAVVAGGEIATTIPTADVVNPVSNVETPAPSLPSAVGAGSSSGDPVDVPPSIQPLMPELPDEDDDYPNPFSTSLPAPVISAPRPFAKPSPKPKRAPKFRKRT